MAKITVGGVPEHFNLPWKMATELGLWEKHGAPAVEFVEVKGGTGAMLGGLRDKSYDVIIALTECLVAEIEKADGVRLVANYVDSCAGTPHPLAVAAQWDGVRVGRVGGGGQG